jgi:hypothetical protein
MIHLQQYGSSDEDGNSDNSRNDFEDITSHLKPLGYGKSIASLQNKMQVCSAPDVVPTVSLDIGSSNEIKNAIILKEC